MATISGAWKWNDTITKYPVTDIISITVNFTSMFGVGVTFRYMQVAHSSTNPYIRYHEPNGALWECYDSRWNLACMQYIDFGSTPQSVDDTFYSWFTSNATQGAFDCDYQITVNGSSTAPITLVESHDDGAYVGVGCRSPIVCGAFKNKVYICRAWAASNSNTVHNITVNGKTVDYAADNTVASKNPQYYSDNVIIEPLGTVYSTDNTGRYGFAFGANEKERGGVTITYNGNTLSTLEAGQTATLVCAGKKMATDVAVTAPELSEPVLQEKTATENGEVTPDDGYDGLSKVLVAVPAAEDWDGSYTVSEGEASPETIEKEV